MEKEGDVGAPSFWVGIVTDVIAKSVLAGVGRFDFLLRFTMLLAARQNFLIVGNGECMALEFEDDNL